MDYWRKECSPQYKERLCLAQIGPQNFGFWPGTEQQEICLATYLYVHQSKKPNKFIHTLIMSSLQFPSFYLEVFSVLF